jgi:hypothetical protein
MKRWLLVAGATLLFCFHAQAAPDALPTPDVQAVISAQFGEEFVLLSGYPVLIGDFNGDGIQDAVFAATSKSVVQTISSRFKMLDPSSDFFGLGDTGITSQFASPYPGGPKYLLVIHGSGKDGWRAKEPKERFVLINLAFDHISVGHFERKKRNYDDINIEETGILNSFLYWDGHKYKWQPGPME